MAKESSFFRDIGTGIFKPVGDFVSGAVTALQPGRSQQIRLDQQRIQALLESEKGRQLVLKSQQLMNEARTGALNRGEGYYGGGKKDDPRIDQISKLISAADKTSDEKLAASLTAQAQLLTDEIGAEGKVGVQDAHGPNVPGMPDVSRQYFNQQQGQFVGPPAPKASDFFAPEEDFVGPPDPRQFKGGQGGTFKGTGASGGWDESPSAYFQAPKTYQQTGITSVDDMAAIDEMQQALPDRDMKAEYEADPEGMKELIKLWRAKKLTKQNLHKAFSAIQQQAQESLGINK